MNKALSFLLSLCCFVLLTSCEGVIFGGGTGSPPPQPQPAPGPSNAKKGGPPAHAKAHGYRKKFGYTYYPSKKVYYSKEKKVWFWIEGDGWKVGGSLPTGLNVNKNDAVQLELDSEEPYDHYKSQTESHPGKGKGKGKGKGRYK